MCINYYVKRVILLFVLITGNWGRGAELRSVHIKNLVNLKQKIKLLEQNILSSLKYDIIKELEAWGWSYGGYMSSLCLLKGNEYFHTAIAVAPVTNWRYYDTIYTERYMRIKKIQMDMILIHQ